VFEDYRGLHDRIADKNPFPILCLMIRDDIKLQDIHKIIKHSIEEYNYKNGIGKIKRKSKKQN